MKRIILPLSLALSLSCGAAFAQQADPAQAPQQAPATEGYAHNHHAPNPQKQAEHLSKKLNLTADQTAKIEPILAQRDQQMQALWQNQQLAPQDRHQQIRSINETAEQHMATVLSPDQMAQLKAMRRNGRHHGPHGDNGDGNQQPS
jgi:periplasmic protein CpxP/Spy